MKVMKEDVSVATTQVGRRVKYTVTIAGVEMGIKDACRTLGIKYKTFFNRVKYIGMDAKTALTAPTANHERELTAWGETDTLSNWCRRRGVSKQAVVKRLHNGYSAEQALAGDLTPEMMREHAKEKRGRLADEDPDMSGVDLATCDIRMLDGRTGNMRRVSIGGKVMRLETACRLFGLKLGTVYDRMRKGADICSALRRKIEYATSKFDTVVVDGAEMSLAEAAAKHGLTMAAVRRRMAHGWPALLAVTKPQLDAHERAHWREDLTMPDVDVSDPSSLDIRVVGTRKTKTGNDRVVVSVNGHEMSINKACRLIGLNASSFWHRLNRGWDIETALKTGLVDAKNGDAIPKVHGTHVKRTWPEANSQSSVTRLERGGNKPIFVTVDGRRMRLRQACKEMGISIKTVLGRLYKTDWSIDAVMHEPKQSPQDCLARAKAGQRRRQLASLGVIY